MQPITFNASEIERETAPIQFTAADVDPARAPDFRTENEKDAAGNAVVRGDPNTAGTFLRHAGRQVNPLPLGQMVPFPKALGGAGWDAPIQAAKGLLEAQGAVKVKGDRALASGDYVTAVRHYIDWLVPVLGPVIDQAADEFQRGNVAAGAGDTVGLAAALFGPSAAAKLRRPVTVKPPAPNPNPTAAAAVQFGEAHGVPIDAGTATGSQFIKNVQKKVGSSWGGANTTEKFQRAQGDALARVGGELADDAHGVPMTPESAGEALRGDVTGLVKTLHRQADDAYGRLRNMEADPANAGDVPAPPPTAAVQGRMADSLGAIPTASELRELRRIRAELDALPFKRGKLMDDDPGVSSGSTYDPRAAGAPVYHDILDVAPGTSEMTRAEVLASIDRALETGSFTNAAKGAMAVARQRLESPGGRAARSALLPPGAGEQPLQRMVMPVDLTATKAGLKPLYERLQREKELTGVLMGDKARALTALDALVSGPDFAPVSVVDAALGDIKAMARGATMPELRTQGQGLAAQAVKELDTAVRQAVERVGPEAVAALTEGRSATTAKYMAAELLESVRAEPVGAYRQAVAPKDTAIQHLRQIREYSPESMPRIGRAFLEELLTKATAEGGFGRSAGLYADWQRLGPATKQLLYAPPLIDALDQFFLLAKKIGENPNPSGTAQVLNATNLIAGLPAYALAKMLHSPKAIALLTKGLRTEIGPGQRSVAALRMARANVVDAARAAGVSAGLPKAAEDQAPAGSRR